MAKPPDPQDEIIRRNLIAFREATGMSQAEAAQAAEIRLDNLRRYESGQTASVPFTVIAALAPIYGHAAEHFAMANPPEPNVDEQPDFILKANPRKEVDVKLFAELQGKVEEFNQRAQRKRPRN